MLTLSRKGLHWHQIQQKRSTTEWTFPHYLLLLKPEKSNPFPHRISETLFILHQQSFSYYLCWNLI
jgi:hypothetical protein